MSRWIAWDRRGWLGLVALLIAAVPAVAAPPAANPLTSPFADQQWMLTDIGGQVHQPWAVAETRAVVLVFIGTNCPISNYYQPTLRGLQQDFTGPGAKWYLVHTDPQVTTDRARQHAMDFSVTAPVVLDPRHDLARAAGATKLPQAAVLTRDGALAYFGRIDDTYVGYGKKRLQPTTRDLHAALTAVLGGQPVATPRTESVGCFIPFAQPAAAR